LEPHGKRGRSGAFYVRESAKFVLKSFDGARAAATENFSGLLALRFLRARNFCYKSPSNTHLSQSQNVKIMPRHGSSFFFFTSHVFLGAFLICMPEASSFSPIMYFHPSIALACPTSFGFRALLLPPTNKPFLLSTKPRENIFGHLVGEIFPNNFEPKFSHLFVFTRLEASCGL
jgi:hypothetical protein